MPKTYQAIGYGRISDAGDRADEGNSVKNQRLIIEDFVKSHPDIQLVDFKIDSDYSGIIYERPAFQEMMQEIVDGNVNCVIVKDQSRFGREYIQTMQYLQKTLPSYGVRFIAINDGIDTLRDNGDADISISIKSILNDAYCRDISKKTRSALQTKRKNGEFVGACTVYGYQKDPQEKNHLVIDEFAAEIVRDIFRMKLNGLSSLKIAGELNLRGVLSPIKYKKSMGVSFPAGGYADKENAKWSATTVIRILKDETYTGVLLQGKQTTYSYKLKVLKDRPTEDWARTENAHDAIIRKQDFELVQQIMDLDARTVQGEDKVQLFSGLLICGCCGNRMTRKIVSYKGSKYHYYYCPTGKRNGCSGSKMVREQDLIDCVFQTVKAHVDSVASLDALLDNLSAERINRAMAKKCQTQMQTNDRQLRQYTSFKAGLYESFMQGVIDKNEYREMKAGYNAEVQRLEQAQALLAQEYGEIRSGKSTRFQWTEVFRQFTDMTQLDRKTVVQLIQSIRILSKTELEITFRYQAEYNKIMRLVQEQKEAV